MIRILLFTILLAMAPHIAIAQAATPSNPVVVVVKVASPWYAPDFLIVRKMRAALPQYQAIPGLSFKIFTIAQPGGEFGGVYLWRDRVAAEAWFSSAWYARVRKERGVEPEVRIFDALLMFEKKMADDAAFEAMENAVVTLVTQPARDDATPNALRRGLAASLAIERQAPGLLRAYAIDAGQGRIGGVYLWRDRTAAEHWFDARWREKVRALRGEEPRIEWFDAPILMPSALAANRVAEERFRAESEKALP
jgi:heme-degrading monooxygenase HmoA